MYKLLVVDDEPLVQVGIKSMLNWADYDIEICGTALNGQAAMKIIQEQLPEIVITDIKMPVMDGLELIRMCRQQYGNDRPSFLILTSYEDFHMVKEALTYHVTDYLVKLELTPETLSDAVRRVLEVVRKKEEQNLTGISSVHSFYDKFFIRLLNNLFESKEQFLLQSRDLNLNFDYSGYVCCYGELFSLQAEKLPTKKQLALFASSIQMIKELTAKYMPCYGLSLDLRHFALIFCYKENSPAYGEEIRQILLGVNTTLKNYYNVSFRCGIGSLVAAPQSIADSYQHSRQSCHITDDDRPFAFFEDCLQEDSCHHSFNISLFKQDLTKAFEEYDSEILQKTIDDICDLFSLHPHYYVQALDAACNILYLSISLLQNGEEIVSQFFQDSPEGYRSIYKQTGVEQIIQWLKSFSRQMCHVFESRSKDYKNHIVIQVKKYINEHIRERLSLNEVAAVFGISPNYLSQLFGKYSEAGFSEYINSCKINESKKLLLEGKLKVYEAAAMLGFESAFYFSKVFKKIEGISPTEYLNTHYSNE